MRPLFLLIYKLLRREEHQVENTMLLDGLWAYLECLTGKKVAALGFICIR